MIYRGREGMWSYYLHRVTGVGVFLFLFAHVLDTALIHVSPQVYDRMMAFYSHPLFKAGEVGLVFAVLYHSINGIRVTLIDFWTGGPKYHRQMFYAVVTLVALTFIPTALLMLS